MVETVAQKMGHNALAAGGREEMAHSRGLALQSSVVATFSLATTPTQQRRHTRAVLCSRHDHRRGAGNQQASRQDVLWWRALERQKDRRRLR